MDVCCFDKTGTLTADEMRFEGLVERCQPAPDADFPPRAITAADMSTTAPLVLAGCQSLVQVDGGLVGDPVERASLEGVGYAQNPRYPFESSRSGPAWFVRRQQVWRFPIVLCTLRPPLWTWRGGPRRGISVQNPSLCVRTCGASSLSESHALIPTSLLLRLTRTPSASIGWTHRWTYGGPDLVHGPDRTAVTILARHHFSSTLKRMSVVVSVEAPRGHDGAHAGVAMALLKVRRASPPR